MWLNIPKVKLGNIWDYYSTNCNTIQICSWCSRYLSSVGNRYPAVYVASYVGRKSEVKKCWQKDLKMLQALLLNNKTIILLNLAEYHRLSIRRYSAQFRRIIVKCSPIFKAMRIVKKIWMIINTIAFLKAGTVFLKIRSGKTFRFTEQIMSVNKYTSIYLHQMETFFLYSLIVGWRSLKRQLI